MNFNIFKKIIIAMGLWMIAYIGLRLLLMPWRMIEKPSLLEIGVSGIIALLYYIFWKSIRRNLIIKRPQRGGILYPILLFFIWMGFYLFFWRISFSDSNVFQKIEFSFLLEYTKNNFLGGLILSEISEEIAYRGILLGLLLKSGLKPFQAVLFQGFVFLLPHYLGLAQGHMDAMRTISTVFLGIIFGWTMIGTNRLSVPIALHIFWNFIAGFVFEYME